MRSVWTKVTRGRRGWWIEILAIAWLAWLYDVITGMAPLRLGEALAHGRSILHAERVLGIDVELTLNHWLAHHHTLGTFVSYYYDNAHFVVTLGLLAWLWWKRPQIYGPLRTSLVLVNVIGFAIFWRYPVAPPRMLGGGFVDVVAASHTFGSWHTGALASDADQLAAMPSLHLAWAVWCSLVLWRALPGRTARVVAIVYPALTTFAVLASANHYVFDVVAGVVTAVVAIAAEAALRRAWRAWLGARMSQACHEVGTSATLLTPGEPR